MSLRPHSIYVSGETFQMLKAFQKVCPAKSATPGFEGDSRLSYQMPVDEIADKILSDHLKAIPGVSELIALRKDTEAEYDAKAAQVVSKFKENGSHVR